MLQMLNRTTQSTQMQQQNNPMQMLQQFNQFKRDMAGKNPEAIVNQLLQSGKMSQQQFEELKQQASMSQNFLN